MTDLTLEDLADGTARGGSRTEDTADAPDVQEVPRENDGPGGEWIKDTLLMLEERGYLEALIFGPDGLADQGQEQAALPGEQTKPAGDPSAPGAGEQATTAAQADTSMQQDNIDSETVAAALKRLYDIKGNIDLKELIQLVENNPEMVDKLLEAHT